MNDAVDRTAVYPSDEDEYQDLLEHILECYRVWEKVKP